MLKDSSSAEAPASKVDTDGPQSRSQRWIAPVVLIATVVIYLTAQIIGGFIVYLYPLLSHWSHVESSNWLTNSVFAQFLYGLIADVLIIAAIAWFLRWFKWSWATIGLKKPKPKHILVGILAAAPYYLIYIVMVAVVSALMPSFNANQEQDIGFNSVHGIVPLILTFISLVILPPLVEEITVRGFLYTGLRKALPKVAAAIVVSALFGAAHLAEGGSAGPLWIGALDTFILSLILVFLREKTGNLWAGITLHAMKNGVAFVILFIVGSR